jgi:prepilin-type N-terminal cleavage/methylation domain-containing protein
MPDFPAGVVTRPCTVSSPVISSRFSFGALRRARGFTLLEILLVMLIIALLGTVIIGASSALLKNRAVTPSEVFWSAVQEARKTALKGGKDVRFTFDAKEKKFVLSDATNADAPGKDFPIPGAGDDLILTFLTTQKGASSILIGGVLVETQKIDAVTFYSDGTCTPFRLQIQKSGDATVLGVDPWTCAAVLPPGDPNAP